MYLLGLDIGSSSVKASLIEVSSGASVASAFSPKTERNEKLDLILPGAMRDNNVDMWIHVSRSGGITQMKSY